MRRYSCNIRRSVCGCSLRRLLSTAREADPAVDVPRPVGSDEEMGLSEPVLRGIRAQEFFCRSWPSATSKRAQDIIDKSRARAMESLVKKASENIEPVTPATVVTKKKTRKTKTSFQPAERKKRLDRSRHMEYKYEVRGLLVDLNVDEEHRSSILGRVWAKGERQTVSDAKEYLNTKLSEGVIDDIQLEALTKVVDNYTIRR